jgi:hypothetical protein
MLKLDRDIALRYGINHYAENGGPVLLLIQPVIYQLLCLFLKIWKKLPDAGF